jgi:hypothetical protein
MQNGNYKNKTERRRRRKMLDRFTSRKFLLAVVGSVVAVLAAAGVIDVSTQQETVAQAAPIVYILVEGLIDVLRGRD